MGVVVKDSGESFENPALGVHRAICVNVFDLGLQPGFNPEDKPKEQVLLLWELESRDSTNRRFTIGKFYTKSVHEKSTLGIDLVSWRGRPFTDEERKGFDLDAVKGKPCQLNLVPTNTGKVKVGAVMRPATEILADGKPHIAQHWAPDTKADFVPPYVKKALEKAIVKQTPPEFIERAAADGFVDDIPFDGRIVVSAVNGADKFERELEKIADEARYQ